MEQEYENLNDLTSGQEFANGQKIVVGNADEDDPESLNEFDNAVAGTVKGRGRKKREVALVYDRYYEKTPRTFLILGAKVLFCCALCVCSMMFVLSNLDMPIDMRMAAIVCFGCTAAFSALFLFVRKSVVIPVAVLVVSVVVWHNRDMFWEKLSWFIDAVLLQLNGRLMQTTDSITHKLLLSSGGDSIIDPFYAGELVFGIVILCMLYSLIVSASMFRKPHFMPILVIFLAMWVPRMIAERMLFNWWLAPTAALFAGAMAMTISHKDGLAIRQGFAHSYRGIVARNEHLFNMRTENSAYLRKTTLRGAYNSKYFSLTVCSTALFLAAITAANAIAGDTHGIDYTKLYEYVTELGNSGFGVTSPFKSGPVSEYFAAPNKTDFQQGSGLSITNPGSGEQEIMRVKNLGTLPMYLRGDIGMDFDGRNWTSPVGGVPELWEESGLDELFYPRELIIWYNNYRMNRYVEQAELSIDYLCDTNVVFTPAYIDYYDSYLDSELFTVYGDFAIRTTDKAGKLGSMRGYAYTPIYIGVEEIDRVNAQIAVSTAEEEAKDAVYLFDGEIYPNYVRETYMGVPEQLKEPIAQYIVDNLLDISEVSDLSLYGADDLETQYGAALEIADYLRDNYTYSLNARVSSRDPVMSFLNDTKSGHCALYASSMTMIMRTLGIPARYCTGFAAKPTDSGGEVLRSKNLHAWCEVYFNELGWVTFDPTSSVSIEAALNGGSGSTSASSSSSSESTSSSVPESSDSDSSSASSDSSSDDNSLPGGFDGSSEMTVIGEKVDIMPYLLTISGIAAGVALIAFVIYRVRRFDKNAKKALKRFYTAENSQSVYARLLAVLKLCKITPNGGELTGDYFKRAGRELGCAVHKHTDLLEKLAFGGGELSDTEKATLARLLEKIFAAANKKLGIIGRIKLRFIMTSRKYRF